MRVGGETTGLAGGVAGGPMGGPSGGPEGAGEYRKARSVEARAAGDTVRLTAYVDRSSVEVFVDGQALTALVFPPAGHREARLAADGPVSLRAGTVTPLAGIR